MQVLYYNTYDDCSEVRHRQKAKKEIYSHFTCATDTQFVFDTVTIVYVITGVLMLVSLASQLQNCFVCLSMICELVCFAASSSYVALCILNIDSMHACIALLDGPFACTYAV